MKPQRKQYHIEEKLHLALQSAILQIRHTNLIIDELLVNYSLPTFGLILDQLELIVDFASVYKKFIHSSDQLDKMTTLEEQLLCTMQSILFYQEKNDPVMFNDILENELKIVLNKMEHVFVNYIPNLGDANKRTL